jgi:glyoxylase-like metal-dependent hydrolase (beta-lactamase superfamily II)
MPTLSPAMKTLPDPSPWRQGLQVFERGWLSSNNVLLHGEPGEGAVLVDSSHTLHAAQTVAIMQSALGDEPLVRLVNTHLHSDHCGGNAALQRAFGCRIETPPGHFDAACRWDEAVLSHQPTGQTCERFRPDGVLAPGTALEVGRRRWQVLAAPGHDPHSVVLFDEAHGVLISADALWGNGFGVLFPELDGEDAFEVQATMLDQIERLAPRHVVPGHGPAFDDVAEALARARRRLAGFVADPPRHLNHGARVLLKYHLMECRQQTLPALRQWLAATPMFSRIWHRLGRPEGELLRWGEGLVQALVDSGALRRQGELVCDA